jgi:hypothetical protein
MTHGLNRGLWHKKTPTNAGVFYILDKEYYLPKSTMRILVDSPFTVNLIIYTPCEAW